MSVFSGKCDIYDSIIMIRCNGYSDEQIDKESSIDEEFDGLGCDDF